MLDSGDMLNVIKKAATEAVSAEKPASIVYGKVISITPLIINVEQKMTLSSAQLVLTRNVTDYQVDMTVNHSTGSSLNVELSHTHTLTGTTQTGGTEPHTHSYTGVTESGGQRNLAHSHTYIGRKTFTVHNKLVVGDEVILIQMQGGQKYIVWDRIGKL